MHCYDPNVQTKDKNVKPLQIMSGMTINCVSSVIYMVSCRQSLKAWKLSRSPCLPCKHRYNLHQHWYDWTLLCSLWTVEVQRKIMTDGKDERNSVIVSMEIEQDPGAVHNREYDANSDTEEKHGSLASKTGKFHATNALFFVYRAARAQSLHAMLSLCTLMLSLCMLGFGC